jgi:signal transduction histidine kinase
VSDTKTSSAISFAGLLGALNLSSDGIVLYEPVLEGAESLCDLRIVTMNDAAVQIFGAPRELAVGSLLSNLWPLDKEEEGWLRCIEVLNTGQPQQYEWETQGLGAQKWFEVLLRDFNGNIAASYHDITERKQNLISLQAQQRFYEELLHHGFSRNAVLTPMYNAAGDIENFRYDFANYGPGTNDSFRQLPVATVSPEGKLLSDISPISVDQFQEFLRALIDTGYNAGKVFTYTCSDGTEAEMEINGKRLSDGRLLVNMSDVGEVQRLASALDKEKSDLDAVLQSVPVGITAFESVRDDDGELKDLRLVRRNDLALALSRIAEDKYTPGALISDLMPKELFEHFDHMLDVVRTGEQLVHELHQPHIDKWILSRAIPHGDGILSTIQDITEIKRYGQQMSQQAHLLEGVLEASPNGITVFEAIRDEAGIVQDFRIVHANDKVIEISGSSWEDNMRLTFFERLPQQRSQLPRLIDLMEHKLTDQTEEFIPETGSWVVTTLTPLGDGFVATVQDVTAQKKQQEEVVGTARLLNAVLDSSPMAVVVYEPKRNSEGEIIDFVPIIANKQALDIAAFSQEDFMSLSLLDRNRGREQDLLPVLISVVTEQKAQIHEHLVPSSGRWVRSITTPFGEGFIATSQDITEHKEQRRIIEEQAELFSGVLSSLQNGLSVLQIIRKEDGELADVKYIEVADSVVNDTGISREETIGQSMLERFPGMEHTDYWKAYETVARTGKPVHFETHFTLEGFDNYLLNWVTPIGNDKLVSVYYIINDLKKAQKELEHTVHELRHSNEDLEQFASIASHDLQEPLRKVQSFGAMLESRYSDALGESGRDLVNRMQGAAGRMRNLVTGLLSFARLSGDEHLPLAPVDLHTLMVDIIADLDHSIDPVENEINIPARLPFVLGIEGQLRHLFHNLLTNALKFRKPGLAPIIEVSFGSLQDNDATRLSPLAHPEQYLRLEVADNGIGFDPEFSDRIFGLFERLHGLSEYQGTGLGLSICRRVAERHEGTIWAEGRPGEGATFVVLLRRAS